MVRKCAQELGVSKKNSSHGLEKAAYGFNYEFQLLYTLQLGNSLKLILL